MKTAENRHITDITMHTDPKTGYITGDFIFDGRTKKDQVAGSGPPQTWKVTTTSTGKSTSMVGTPGLGEG